MGRHRPARALIFVAVVYAILNWAPVVVLAAFDPPEVAYPDFRNPDGSDNVQAVVDARFPYCVCKRNPPFPSAYSMAPTITFKGNNTYCFTVRVNTTGCRSNDTCCWVNLNKIEFNVNSTCTRTTAVNATVGGVPTVIRPNFYYFPMPDDSRKHVLRLTGLNLSQAASNNTEVCLILRAPTAAGCDTVDKLCVPPTSSQGLGTCQVAFFNTLDFSGSCCPISTPSTPKPPPPVPRPPPPPKPPTPPKPPSPRPLSPPPSCRECINITINPAPTTFPPLILRASQCAYYQSLLVTELAGIAANLNISLAENFIADPGNCLATSLLVCGTFATTPDIVKLSETLTQSLNYVISEIVGDLCPLTKSLQVLVVPEGGNCVDVWASQSCSQPPTIASCNCNTTQFITPFYVEPTIREEPGRFIDRKLYCFTLNKLPSFLYNETNTCGNSTVLSKLEIYANEALRSHLTGIRVTPGDGSFSGGFRSPSWGGRGTNTVKVSPLNWVISKATNASVCLELNVPLETFCLSAYNACRVSLFNERSTCCPTYPATLLDFP